MVGMTRAHIADPHIVRKIMEGREDQIRPCVGATYCLDRIYEGGEALCIHNAATGREADDAARDRAGRPDPPKRSWSSAPGRPGWRPPASRPSAATRSPCSRRPRRPAGRSGWPPAEPAPQGADRHRRLAPGRARAARRRASATTSGPRRDDVLGAAPGRGHRRHRRPAANPPLDAGDELGHLELGHPRRRRQAGRERAALRRQWRPPGHDAPPRSIARCRRQAGARLARALLRARDGRHEPRALHARLQEEGVAITINTRVRSVRREGGQLDRRTLLVGILR